MAMTYEACASSLTQARAAQVAGANRLELCARLAVGGVTPPIARVAAARRALVIPVHVMIRPRAGAYTASRDELREMERTIAEVRLAGANGVVIGVLDADGEVDQAAVKRLAKAARGMSVTFHRAFDLVPVPLEAMEVLIGLGVDRILTSGGAPTARQGISVLRRLVRAARGRIGIIGCGRVRAGNVRALIAATGVREVHAHLLDPAAMRALARMVRGSNT